MDRARRTDLGLAVAAAGWAVPFLAGNGTPWPGIGTALLLGAAMPLVRRRPTAGFAAVLAVLGLQWAAGIPVDNPAPVVAELVAAYHLGRYAPPAAAGVLLPAAALLAAARDGFGPATGVFTLVLGAGTWTFGILVRRRTAQARRSTRVAHALARTDPAGITAAVVAAERARLAGDTLRVVREAVTAMLRAADRHPGPDAAALEAVQVEGRTATAELRRLLGLLRAEPAQDAGTATGPPPTRAVAVSVGTAALLTAAALAEGGPRLAVGLALLPALRLVGPATAASVGALVPATALATGSALVTGTAGAAGAAVLAWSVAVDGRPRSWAAFALFTALLAAAGWRDDPENLPLLLALVAVAAGAGHVWGARDREERAAAASAEATRAVHAAVAERAVRAERLRLARELHDVTSHAVGVMVVQAGAAATVLGRDPDAAAAHLDAVRRAGVAALAELDVLDTLLEPVPTVPADTAGAADLPDALEELARRVRPAGVDVRLRVAGGSGPHDATVYRIVQEALTNAVRHAPGSRVVVTVSHGSNGPGVSVEVSDDGPGSSGGTGFGLVGLTERVRALGGELSAGPGVTGGFTVRATLP